MLIEEKTWEQWFYVQKNAKKSDIKLVGLKPNSLYRQSYTSQIKVVLRIGFMADPWVITVRGKKSTTKPLLNQSTLSQIL